MELITRPNSAEPEKRGPAFEPASNLLADMRKNGDILERHDRGDDVIFNTPAIEFKAGKKSASATAYMVESDPENRIFLALDPDTSNHYMIEYQIVDGIITRLSGNTWVDT